MRRIIMLLVGCVCLAGCGGGSSNRGAGSVALPGGTARITLSVVWGARTRVINAPSSALSGVLTLPRANPVGGDFVFAFDRNDTPLTSYSQTFTTPTSALFGTWSATVTFYANKGGQGSVVGIARKQVFLSTPTIDLGDIATTGSVASVTVPDTQTFPLGQPADLIFSALDAGGKALAVTPGSAKWTVKSVTPQGYAPEADTGGHLLPMYPEDLDLTVAVDGKTSPPTHVHIVASPRYTLTALGTLPGDFFSTADGLNARGDVVGTSQNHSPTGHAFLWTPAGGMQNLGTLPGDTNSAAFGVNASDQVVGISAGQFISDSKDGNPNNVGHAFLWSPGSGMQSLPLTAAYGINDSGQVVGQANGHAALWTPAGGVTDLGVLPGCDISVALAIDNAGQVLCHAFSSSGTASGSFLWTSTGGIQAISAGYATALSSNGTVAGIARGNPGDTRQSWFTWTSGGGLKYIPVPDTLPQDTPVPSPAGINASGQLVATIFGDYDLFIANGLWVNLDYYLSSGHVYNAQGINDNGQIIAQALDKAILLTPIPGARAAGRAKQGN